MPDTIIECAEVAGKTVARLRLATGECGGQEVHIEFTDATALSVTTEPVLVRKAQLISQSDSGNSTIRD